MSYTTPGVKNRRRNFTRFILKFPMKIDVHRKITFHFKKPDPLSTPTVSSIIKKLTPGQRICSAEYNDLHHESKIPDLRIYVLKALDSDSRKKGHSSIRACRSDNNGREERRENESRVRGSLERDKRFLRKSSDSTLQLLVFLRRVYFLLDFYIVFYQRIVVVIVM